MKRKRTGKYFIYRIYSTGFVGCYIGQSVWPVHERFRNHKLTLIKGNHTCKRFQYFYDNISKELEIEVLMDNVAGIDLDRLERELIEADLTSFNLKKHELGKNKRIGYQLFIK